MLSLLHIGNSSGYISLDTDSTHINICLVGCVSAGKSTILNAFFGQDYTQCKIKRTTMMPNKFIETDNPSFITPFEIINRTIADVNQHIYTQTDEGKIPLKLEDYGNELTFDVGSMEMNVGKKIKICIYDIPGLNDARTKDVYYKYLENNFHKFNIILFVVDIQSGLNTSDEMDILNFLTLHIQKHKIHSNKKISMLTIVNKADDMQLNGNELEVLGELGEMFEQTTNTVKQKFIEKNILDNLLECIPICGLDSHLYRMIKKFKDINKLTDENVLRIGVNEEGSKFRKYTKIEQRRKVQEKNQDSTFVNDMITLSGFSQIESALNKFIDSNGGSMVMENLLFDYNKLPPIGLDNLIQNLITRVEILENIKPYKLNVYNIKMNECIKAINTIIYSKINCIDEPNEIKTFYDVTIIGPINSIPSLKKSLMPFTDIDVYPTFIVDRILELVTKIYSKNRIHMTKLGYITLFEKMNNFKPEIIDVIMSSLITNPNGGSTINFKDCVGQPSIIMLIKLMNKFKISKKFIEFIRFVLINMYNELSIDQITKKIMIFERFQEIPLSQFLLDLNYEKKIRSHTSQTKTLASISNYLTGLDKNCQEENLIEIYYILMCYEYDPHNIQSNNIQIDVDFDDYIG